MNEATKDIARDTAPDVAPDTAPDAAEAEAWARLEQDMTSVKTDIAHLSHQISDAANALGTVAGAETRRGVRRARANVDMMASGASDRALSVAHAAEKAATSIGDTLTGVIQERPVAAVTLAMGVGFLIGATWRR